MFKFEGRVARIDIHVVVFAETAGEARAKALKALDFPGTTDVFWDKVTEVAP